jgi:hypothetical protein
LVRLVRRAALDAVRHVSARHVCARAWRSSRTPRLLAFLLIVTAVGFASDPINTEAPALARELGYHDTVAGLIIGAFGFGAVSAAFLLAGPRGRGVKSPQTAPFASS